MRLGVLVAESKSLSSAAGVSKPIPTLGSVSSYGVTLMAEDTYHDGDGLSMEGGGPSGGGDAASDDQHQEEEGLGWLGDEESSSDDEGDF